MTDRDLLELIAAQVGNLTTQVEEITIDIAETRTDMQKGFNHLNDEIKRVKDIIVRIENDHGQKLGILLDGYKLMSERLDRIEQEVAKHLVIALIKRVGGDYIEKNKLKHNSEVLQMYENLLVEAHGERVEVVYRPFRGKIKGLYCDNIIAINRNTLTTAERTCILAEELGHYHTSVGDILDQTKLPNRKQEQRARRWGYEKLIPLDKLIAAHKAGVYSGHELAEYLNVTEEFLAAALQYYAVKHGTYCRVGSAWICFNPFRIYERL